MATPFLAEIKIVSFPFAPKGWAFCNGQLMPIAQLQDLYQLIGTPYGGDGKTTFALPDLRGRIALHQSQTHAIGEKGGTEAVTLTEAQMPLHLHALNCDATTPAASNTGTPLAGMCLGQTVGSPAQGSNFTVSLYEPPSPPFNNLAPKTLGATGGSQPHPNMQAYLSLAFIIALQGLPPKQG